VAEEAIPGSKDAQGRGIFRKITNPTLREAIVSMHLCMQKRGQQEAKGQTPYESHDSFRKSMFSENASCTPPPLNI